MVVSLSRARNLAAEHGLAELSYEPKYDRVTFTCNYSEDPKCTLDYYYTSGTIVSKLVHTIMGYTELTRCCMTEKELNKLFKNPRAHVGKRGKGGYHYLASSRSLWGRKNEKDPESGKRGKYFTGRLFDGDMIKNGYSESARCVALGDSSMLWLYDNGGCGIVCGLFNDAHDLYIKLRCFPENVRLNKGGKREKSKQRGTYCVLGSHNRYYAEYKDHRPSWKACDKLQQLLTEGGKVSCIAFGKGKDDFFIKFENGKAYWEGLPKEVNNILTAQSSGKSNHLDNIDKVSLGPKGEWYVRFTDGNHHAGNLSDKAKREIRELNEKSRKIRDILFGGKDTYMIRFDK